MLCFSKHDAKPRGNEGNIKNFRNVRFKNVKYMNDNNTTKSNFKSKLQQIFKYIREKELIFNIKRILVYFQSWS